MGTIELSLLVAARCGRFSFRPLQLLQVGVCNSSPARSASEESSDSIFEQSSFGKTKAYHGKHLEESLICT